MSVEFTTGDLFESSCEALVNAVNTVGVMGGGIALEFKRRFPAYFEDYVRQCDWGILEVGSCETYETELERPRFIVSLPTKAHYRNPSELSYVGQGLNGLRFEIADCGIKSIAIPALGCGLGLLDYVSEVKPLLETLDDISDCRIVCYEPL